MDPSRCSRSPRRCATPSSSSAADATRRWRRRCAPCLGTRRDASSGSRGHIHHAELREIDGMVYANDGDWVESMTALVEHPGGRLEIIDRSRHISAPAPLVLPQQVPATL